MTAVSAAVADAASLDETLRQIALTAASLVGASACAIYLRDSEDSDALRVATSYGFSDAYTDRLNSAQPPVVGRGPSGIAIERGKPVSIVDILHDPICAPWRSVARRERVRSMVSVPLRPKKGVVMGNLNAYRREPGPWTAREVSLLSVLADHAAIAIRTADLLDHGRRQVEGLSLMVRSLRAQAHEHSNRLHAIHGLLTLGEAESARRMIASIEDSYHSTYGRAISRIHNPILAGFLVAESAIALQMGTRLSLDARSRLDALPASLDDLDALTVLGNLVHNALDAVAEMPRTRRKVTVALMQTRASTLFRVRDWGVGLTDDVADRIFDREFTTKRGHSGIGLSLVDSIVRRCKGEIEVVPGRRAGVAISVRFPA